ncbi:guanitoxin biosynthesis L-enduracididine beta-hydroxylase GntD [Streptomyces sp. ACA25]|uniref:guanitoxin biosynthesis L-enduracididine beta-hydroxylase GntD n=1 Tax=Streptomyces sp. ACA25 TaxID=3022596 RepID=UPI0023071297|nr:guanitoxin biosynthesis L-enduracididine beta-hydroxylase GntD [Streptomyces sp. ACA25]MDB1088331.1 guanitoxin biosynthesis L-enduracididine beta-hydroxylase GntD [Streptomyces sp. ACA25]
MLTYQLLPDDIATIDELTEQLLRRYDSVESPEFQREARIYSEELPRPLRRTLHEFRSSESTGTLVIKGLPVEDAALGATPTERTGKTTPSASLRQDIAFYLAAGLLGEPIGWATQQDGRIMHDVYPIAAHESEQIGWGSAETLAWHTEDAFHLLRTDYVALMCLRNPDEVETTVADVADIEIDDETREMLSQPRFRILPDASHRLRGEEDEDGHPRVSELRRRSLEHVERSLESPEPTAVLFGDPDDPYVVIDPHYMQGVQGEDEQRVLDVICRALDSAMTGVTLTPGDICFLDNYRVVHGRKPFRARFDGTDRWLRRLNVARDLRKSRASRLSATSRVIY